MARRRSRQPARADVVRRRLAGAAVAVALVLGVTAVPAAASAPEGAGTDDLYLVTLAGPGTAGDDSLLPRFVTRLHLRSEQQAVLDEIGAPVPVYRWTTALNGFAAHLSRAQAAVLAADPQVALVERSTVRPVAGLRAARPDATQVGRARGGAGTVIGVVDSGIWPDDPLFSPVPGLGRAPHGFRGECQAGDGWPTTTCNRKLVGAHWFVDGFGRDRVRSTSSLSPRDDEGHGTQIASIAAGNAGVTVRVREQRLGQYAGVAPQARLAVYKACWTAPDPADDGCATADLVSAIDQAAADGVDVLNLSVGGPDRFDTVERALLGAAEAGVVVVGAAGNDHRSAAAHAGPWATTVGAVTGAERRGRVVAGDGLDLTGAMAARRAVGPARVVLGADVPAAGARRAEARVCSPGSLDASRVGGRIVVCERGRIGRVDKSAAVAEADGAGMVLTNVGQDSVVADFHSVPTVHVDAAAGRSLRRWVGVHPAGRVRLVPVGLERAPARVAHWSSSGDPAGSLVKPDVVATGTSVLGAVPPTGQDRRWDLVSGTSAATAATSGAAALLLSRRDWSAAEVRSALATTARPMWRAGPLRAGAGRVSPSRALRPGLVYDVRPGDYRAWLDGTLHGDLNTPSVLLAGDDRTATRTITNAGHRRLYFSSWTGGFEHHRVRVTPAAVRLGPGESQTFRVSVDRTTGPEPLDDGWVTWRGATGTVTRIPVVISR